MNGRYARLANAGALLAEASVPMKSPTAQKGDDPRIANSERPTYCPAVNPGCPSASAATTSVAITIAENKIAITIFDTQEHASFRPERLGDVGAQLRAVGLQIEAPAVYEAVE